MTLPSYQQKKVTVRKLRQTSIKAAYKKKKVGINNGSKTREEM
jgi:hypothetical protein